MNKLKTTEQKEPDIYTEDYYAILGVDPDANPAEIKKAYKQLAVRFHPDKGSDGNEFKIIKEAYEILMNPKKRERYDKYGRIKPEEITQANSMIHAVVEAVINSNKDLSMMDIVGSIKINIDQNLNQASNERDKSNKKLNKLEKNRHRTNDDVILAVFLKNIGMEEQKIMQIEEQIRIMEIAKMLVKNCKYEFEVLAPVEQQWNGMKFFTVGP